MMPNSPRRTFVMLAAGPAVAAALLVGSALAVHAAPAKPPAEPAKIAFAVDPAAPGAGQTARVTMSLTPIEGVKINRYPKIKLAVTRQPDLLGDDVLATLGNEAPPPPGSATSNYFDGHQPVRLDFELPIDAGAAAGEHRLDGKLTYFYCVVASGFCAPARVDVSIPVSVH